MIVPKKSKQIGTTIQTTLSHFTCNQSKTLGSFVRSKQACSLSRRHHWGLWVDK